MKIVYVFIMVYQLTKCRETISRENKKKLKTILDKGKFDGKSNSSESFKPCLSGAKKCFVFNGKGNSVKLEGFDNIESTYNKEKLRETVDDNTGFVILPEKPVIVAPLIIRGHPSKNKWRYNHNFVLI